MKVIQAHHSDYSIVTLDNEICVSFVRILPSFVRISVTDKELNPNESDSLLYK